MNQKLQHLMERIDALDSQLQAVRRQQDQLTKRKKQIKLQKAQRAVMTQTKGPDA